MGLQRQGVLQPVLLWSSGCWGLSLLGAPRGRDTWGGARRVCVGPTGKVQGNQCQNVGAYCEPGMGRRGGRCGGGEMGEEKWEGRKEEGESLRGKI